MAAAAAAEFPPELWVEILTRLPAKILVRFRCVSKTWRSIIDNPNFIHMHLNTGKNNPKKQLLSWEFHDTETRPERVLKIVLRSMDEFRNFEEIMSFDDDSTRGFTYLPISYVDGLMLIQRNRKWPVSYEYILFNPSTRLLQVLPPPPSDIGDFCFFLGLDRLTDQHKVFMIRFPSSIPQDRSYITLADYALNTGCWSHTRVTKEHHHQRNLGMSLYAKGVMHWMYGGRTPFKVWDYTRLLSFDTASETFSMTSLPGDEGDYSERFRIPFLFGDAFAILDVSETSICIWVLEECAGSDDTYSWSRWYEGPSDSDILGLFRPHFYRTGQLLSLLYREEKGKFLLVEEGDEIGYQMKSYDIESGMMEDLETSPRGQMLGFMGPYVESLLANTSNGHSWTSIPRENRSRIFNPYI